MDNHIKIGRLTWPGGKAYDGEHRDKLPHGKGKMTFPGGEIYEGDFLEGKANGQGKMIFANGNVYTGSWKANQRHGRGRYDWNSDDSTRDSIIYEGNAQVVGIKAKISKKGNWYSGDWDADQPAGLGEFFFAHLGGATYKGEVSNWEPNGVGKMHWPNGSEYLGEMTNGVINGQGIYISGKTGIIYDGSWKTDVRDGYLVMKDCTMNIVYAGYWADNRMLDADIVENVTFLDGRKYSGGWCGNAPQGFGIMTNPDGTIQECIWEEGLPAGIRESLRKATSASKTNFSESRCMSMSKPLDLLQEIERYTQAITDHPNDAAAYQKRGEIYRKMYQHEKAIMDFDAAINLLPSFAAAYLSRGAVYHEIKQYWKAIPDYDMSIKLEPTQDAAFSNRGNAFLKLQQYERAIVDFNEAIRLAPNDAHPYASRGNAHVGLKQYDQAIADITEAIRMNPTHAYSYCMRGGVNKNLKNYDAALADFTKAIELNEASPMYRHERGRLFASLKQYSEALADFDKAIALNPKDADYYSNRSKAYEALGRTKEALDDQNEAIRLNPNWSEQYNARGELKRREEQYEEALADFNEAISRAAESKAAPYYANKGLLLHYLKRYEEALDSFNRAMDIAPNPRFDRYRTKLREDMFRADLAAGSTETADSLPDSDEEPVKIPVVELFDDNGDKVVFELLDTIEYEGDKYCLLTPYYATAEEYDMDSPADVFVMKELADDENSIGEPMLETVEDEDLIQDIYTTFKNKHVDKFEFRDDT